LEDVIDQNKTSRKKIAQEKDMISHIEKTLMDKHIKLVSKPTKKDKDSKNREQIFDNWETVVLTSEDIDILTSGSGSIFLSNQIESAWSEVSGEGNLMQVLNFLKSCFRGLIRSCPKWRFKNGQTVFDAEQFNSWVGKQIFKKMDTKIVNTLFYILLLKNKTVGWSLLNLKEKLQKSINMLLSTQMKKVGTKKVLEWKQICFPNMFEGRTYKKQILDLPNEKLLRPASFFWMREFQPGLSFEKCRDLFKHPITTDFQSIGTEEDQFISETLCWIVWPPEDTEEPLIETFFNDVLNIENKA